MADAVRRIMEDMVPELEDLQKRGLASAREVRQLAKRRERLEYAIAKPGAARDDFLRYLQLELNLASLVACRRKRLSMPRRGASDWNIRKRVHFIFHRATRRFKGDERLWLQWADYCERTGAAKRLGRVYAQALSMLPACARLWVKAAAWEMDGRHNAGAARRLLQRGLRVNAAERSLWLAYFRFELLFLLRVSERRELLGLAGAADDGDAAAARRRRTTTTTTTMRRRAKTRRTPTTRVPWTTWTTRAAMTTTTTRRTMTTDEEEEEGEAAGGGDDADEAAADAAAAGSSSFGRAPSRSRSSSPTPRAARCPTTGSSSSTSSPSATASAAAASSARASSRASERRSPPSPPPSARSPRCRSRPRSPLPPPTAAAAAWRRGARSARRRCGGRTRPTLRRRPPRRPPVRRPTFRRRFRRATAALSTR